MKMNFRDQLSGFFWLAISILVCIEAVGSDLGTFRSPGSGFVPFWAGVFFGILSIVLLVTGIVKKQREEQVKNLWKGRNWSKVIIVMSSLVVYAFLVENLGYLIATFGLMMLMFGIISKTRWWVRGVTAVLTAFTTYIIFYVWLEVQLPKGIFGPF